MIAEVTMNAMHPSGVKGSSDLLKYTNDRWSRAV